MALHKSLRFNTSTQQFLKRITNNVIVIKRKYKRVHLSCQNWSQDIVTLSQTFIENSYAFFPSDKRGTYPSLLLVPTGLANDVSDNQTTRTDARSNFK